MLKCVLLLVLVPILITVKRSSARTADGRRVNYTLFGGSVHVDHLNSVRVLPQSHEHVTMLLIKPCIGVLEDRLRLLVPVDVHLDEGRVMQVHEPNLLPQRVF